MKKVSLFLVVCLFSLGSVFANDAVNGTEPSQGQKLAKQISSLLNKNAFTENDLGHSADILFMLNNDMEIVVLSVDTDEKHIERFIKNKLNYQKADLKTYEPGKKYTIAVKIAS